MAIYITQLGIALAVLPFTVTQGADCIARSSDLADSIFNNTANGNNNWDNLRRAFFPPNKRVNQIIAISYYYPQASNDSLMEMFRWSWSPVLLFIDPYAFEFLSLLVVDLNEGEASVNITTSFCNITKEDRLSLLNEFTTVVRGYVVNGYSSGQQKIDVRQIGYANYYNGQVYITYEDHIDVKRYFIMLIVSSAIASFFLPLCCGPCYISPICKDFAIGSYICCCCCCLTGDERDRLLDNQQTNEEKSRKKRRSSLFLGSLLASNAIGIYALIIDCIHINKELTKINRSGDHNKIYNGWIAALVVCLAVDLFVACITNIQCIFKCFKQETGGTYQHHETKENSPLLGSKQKKKTEEVNTHRGGGGSKEEEKTEKKEEEVRKIRRREEEEKKEAEVAGKKGIYFCTSFWSALSLYFSQILFFHLIFIGLAFSSYPAEAFGILVVALSVTTMCTISLALVCFAYSHNRCVSIVVLTILCILCTTYTIILVSVVHVTEFFDYTDDFEDSTVNSISIAFLSAAIAVAPSLILIEQYNHLCKIIEQVCSEIHKIHCKEKYQQTKE